MKIVLVSDPMCSWCWGMAEDFEQARQTLSSQITFELMLGGINIHGTQPIGDYGRRFMKRLWEDVAATTGQPFGSLYAGAYVHNSVVPCLAIEAIGELVPDSRLDVLHRLQANFFMDGLDITDRTYLRQIALDWGCEAEAFDRKMADPNVFAKLKFQFETAGQFGTQALPSLLVGEGDAEHPELRLLAGGYVDSGMLQTLIEARIS
ncbi:MAG: DsbA family protein [Pseudomonadota bacterium]